MKNILSYKLGTKFTGKEIKQWVDFQIKNKTSKYKVALQISKDSNFYNIKDDAYYMFYKGKYEESENKYLLWKA